MLVILGPTASGKTRLAVQVAARLNGEIISADSRQVYRGMDIGTGKDLAEYTLDNQPVPYHLIDVLDAGDDYNVHRYQQDFSRVVAEITARNRVPVVCGGTGLYLSAVLNDFQFTAIPINEPLRAELALLTDDGLRARFAQMPPSAYTPLADTSTRKRLIRAIEISEQLRSGVAAIISKQLPMSSEQPQTTNRTSARYEPNVGPVRTTNLIFGLDLPVDIRRQRITARLHHRLQNGMIQEVEQLLAGGVRAEKLIFYGLEYKFITQFLTGQLDYNTMVARLETAIHQFAKRQMTYFRKMERDSHQIHWLDAQRPTDELAREIAD